MSYALLLTILGIAPYEYLHDIITKREAKWPFFRLAELPPQPVVGCKSPKDLENPIIRQFSLKQYFAIYNLRRLHSST